MAVKWLDDPEKHDYDASADYLSLLAESDSVEATVSALGSAKTLYHKAALVTVAVTSAAGVVAGRHVCGLAASGSRHP